MCERFTRKVNQYRAIFPNGIEQQTNGFVDIIQVKGLGDEKLTINKGKATAET